MKFVWSLSLLATLGCVAFCGACSQPGASSRASDSTANFLSERANDSLLRFLCDTAGAPFVPNPDSVVESKQVLPSGGWLVASVLRSDTSIVHGQLRAYDSSGHLVVAMYADHGMKVGAARTWYSNGKIASLACYCGDSTCGRAIFYYTNGRPSRVVSMKSERVWATISDWDSSGRSLVPGNVVDGNGVAIYYHAKGKVSEFGAYRNGLRTGRWTNIQENGDTLYPEYIDGWYIGPNGEKLFYIP